MKMTEKLKITFLGTSDAVPSAKRNHTSIYMNYKDENLLIDCGEGTQRQFRKAGLNPCKVSRLLITHWHGDHVLGVPGLLQTLALSGFKKGLSIYGPEGTKKFSKEMLKSFVFADKYSLEVEEVSGRSGKFIDTEDFYFRAKGMNHGVPCNAYCFKEKDRIRIDKKKLKKTSLPEGPLLQDLKKGKDVKYEGRKYKAKDFTYEEKGKKVCFVLDTGYNDKIVDFVKDADILVSESTFSKELEEHAKEYNHMTAQQAGQIAKKAGVKKLILTHISQRYEPDNFKQILGEAKEEFENTVVAKDLESFELK